MTKLSNAFVAAFCSRILAAGLGLVVLPIYYRLLGANDFGVISFFLSLQVMVCFLDLGLGATLIRKLSQNQKENPYLAKNYAKTFEALYLILAIAVALILMAVSGWLATHWIQATSEQLPSLPNQLRIAAVTICMVWFSSIYTAMLVGQEQQFKLAVSQAILAVLRFAIPLGAVTWSQDLTVFFVAYLLVAVLQIVLMRWVAVGQLPQTVKRAVVDFTLLRSDAGFSIGMLGIFLTTFLITQTDKIILSKQLSIANFGLYTLCLTLASGIYLAVQPLFNVLLPRFTRLIEGGEESELRHLYHLAAQLMALMVIPISMLIVAFPREILFAWTAQPSIVEQGAWILRLLVIANVINAIMNLPYCLQLASGWTALPLKVNYVALIGLLPGMVWAVNGWGALGGAIVTLLLQLGILLIVPHITHAKLLHGEKLHWYKYGLILPTLSCGILMFVASWVWSGASHRGYDVIVLAVLLILGVLTTLSCMLELRRFVWSLLVERINVGFLKGKFG
jgi:O-antigen/teichoic acid export membrane protein